VIFDMPKRLRAGPEGEACGPSNALHGASVPEAGHELSDDRPREGPGGVRGLGREYATTAWIGGGWCLHAGGFTSRSGRDPPPARRVLSRGARAGA
jgi:hypothetical protein